MDTCWATRPPNVCTYLWWKHVGQLGHQMSPPRSDRNIWGNSATKCFHVAPVQTFGANSATKCFHLALTSRFGATRQGGWGKLVGEGRGRDEQLAHPTQVSRGGLETHVGAVVKGGDDSYPTQSIHTTNKVYVQAFLIICRAESFSKAKLRRPHVPSSFHAYANTEGHRSHCITIWAGAHKPRAPNLPMSLIINTSIRFALCRCIE